MVFKLSELELVELKYLQALGYKYLAKHENGKVEVFREEPKRIEAQGSPVKWWHVPGTIEVVPLIGISMYHDVKIGEYKALQWECDPILIETLIDNQQVTLAYESHSHPGCLLKAMHDRCYKEVNRFSKMGVCYAVFEPRL